MKKYSLNIYKLYYLLYFFIILFIYFILNKKIFFKQFLLLSCVFKSTLTISPKKWACAWQGNTTRNVLKKINFDKLSVVRDPKGGTVKQCRRIYTYTFAHKVFAYNFPLWTQTLSIIYEFPSSTCFLYVGFFFIFYSLHLYLSYAPYYTGWHFL